VQDVPNNDELLLQLRSPQGKIPPALQLVFSPPIQRPQKFDSDTAPPVTETLESSTSGPSLADSEKIEERNEVSENSPENVPVGSAEGTTDEESPTSQHVILRIESPRLSGKRRRLGTGEKKRTKKESSSEPQEPIPEQPQPPQQQPQQPQPNSDPTTSKQKKKPKLHSSVTGPTTTKQSTGDATTESEEEEAEPVKLEKPKKSHRQKGSSSVRSSKSGKELERIKPEVSPRKKGTPPITPRGAAAAAVATAAVALEKEKKLANEREGKEVFTLEQKNEVVERPHEKEDTNSGHIRKHRQLKKSKSRSKMETAAHPGTPMPVRSKNEPDVPTSEVLSTNSTKARKQAKQLKPSTESSKEASGEKITSPREDSVSDD